MTESEIKTVSMETVRDHLIGHYGLERPVADTILNTYVKAIRENLQKLQEAVLNQNGKEAGNLAHALKGTFLNVGQTQLADTMLLLEKELPEKINTRHVTLVEQLIEALQPITEADLAVK